MINSKFTIVTFYQFKKIHNIFTIKNELSYFCKFNQKKVSTFFVKYFSVLYLLFILNLLSWAKALIASIEVVLPL